MNDSQIEALLRRPPRPAPPAGLKAQLLADIRLPQQGGTEATAESESRLRDGVSTSASFGWRWFPALSFAALLLGCFIMVAWQTSQWWDRRRENQTLRAGQPDLDALRATQEALQKRVAAAERTAIAAREQEEVLKLRDEVAHLTAREQEVATFQAENRRLRAELAAAAAAAGAGQEAEEDPFAQAQERAHRINCVNNMKQIGLGLRMWANDNKDVFPMDFLSASNELNTPKILTCISDTARQRANNWQEFNGSSVSYEFLNPGGTEADPSVVLTRCPIHNNVGLSDGSVQQLGPQQRLEQIDGKWKIVRNPQP